MGSSHTLDQLDTCFDDTHAVANAGLLLAATLAERLGIEQTADAVIDLGERAGAHRPGRKLLTLVHSRMYGKFSRALRRSGELSDRCYRERPRKLRYPLPSSAGRVGLESARTVQHRDAPGAQPLDALLERRMGGQVGIEERQHDQRQAFADRLTDHPKGQGVRDASGRLIEVLKVAGATMIASGGGNTSGSSGRL
jgi:hypothetical protein